MPFSTHTDTDRKSPLLSVGFSVGTLALDGISSLIWNVENEKWLYVPGFEGVDMILGNDLASAEVLERQSTTFVRELAR